MGTTRFLEDQLNRPSRSLMSSSIDNILHRLMSIPVDNRSLISAFSHYGLTGNRKILSKAEVYHLNKFGIPLATDTEERVVQSIIDASDGATRIYGSAFELCTHLKFFRNFVGADWFFKLNEFYPIPEIRISMKKRQFVCKQELFDAMHVQMILLVDPFNTPMVGSVGFIFVKYMKRHVEDCYEMVELERLKSLNIAYEKMFRHEAETELAGEKQWGDVESESDLLKLWKQLLPSENVEFGYEEFKKDLEHFCKDCPLRENMSAHKEVFMICSKLVHCFQQLIDQNPRIFRPFLSTKNNDDPIAIRLFYDNSHRFLMYNEVRKAMIKVANSGSEHVVKDDSAEMGGIACPDGFLSTLSMREVVSCFEREGLSMDRIELIPTIISRAKHSAVPIITSSGDHCKLISDVFFELMREAIFGKKFFQRANGNWRLIEKVFASFDHWFRPMVRTCRFRFSEIFYYFRKPSTFFDMTKFRLY